MTLRLARDDHGTPVPLMALKQAGGQKISVTATSARSTALGIGANGAGSFVRLYSTEDCYVNPGGSAVVALTTTSHFLPAATYLDIYVKASHRYISAIRATADGTLYVSELEGED
jgi:hypothetical protein